MKDFTDEDVARWAREQNRGVPPWKALGEGARAWWRERYIARVLTTS